MISNAAGITASGGIIPKAGWGVIAALMIGAGIGLFFRSTSTNYLTAEVTRGPIVRAIIATGTVNPVTTVQVGTYVSGGTGFR